VADAHSGTTVSPCSRAYSIPVRTSLLPIPWPCERGGDFRVDEDDLARHAPIYKERSLPADVRLKAVVRDIEATSGLCCEVALGEVCPDGYGECKTRIPSRSAWRSNARSVRLVCIRHFELAGSHRPNTARRRLKKSAVSHGRGATPNGAR
jgi:hypothetical protein